VLAAISKLPSSLLLAPLEVGYERELLVNKEKFLTGQAAGLSNGVKGLPLIKWCGLDMTFKLITPWSTMKISEEPFFKKSFY
jgi:hypothetical protein